MTHIDPPNPPSINGKLKTIEDHIKDGIIFLDPPPPAPPNDASFWSSSNPPPIELVFKTPAYLNIFKKYLKSNQAIESYSFWAAVVDFQNNVPDHDLLDFSKRLYGEYLSKGSRTEINIDASVRQAVADKILTKSITRDLFTEASNECIKLVAEDVYQRFVSSPLFIPMLSSAYEDEYEYEAPTTGLTPKAQSLASNNRRRSSSIRNTIRFGSPKVRAFSLSNRRSIDIQESPPDPAANQGEDEYQDTDLPLASISTQAAENASKYSDSDEESESILKGSNLTSFRKFLKTLDLVPETSDLVDNHKFSDPENLNYTLPNIKKSVTQFQRNIKSLLEDIDIFNTFFIPKVEAFKSQPSLIKDFLSHFKLVSEFLRSLNRLFPLFMPLIEEYFDKESVKDSNIASRDSLARIITTIRSAVPLCIVFYKICYIIQDEASQLPEWSQHFHKMKTQPGPPVMNFVECSDIVKQCLSMIKEFSVICLFCSFDGKSKLKGLGINSLTRQCVFWTFYLNLVNIQIKELKDYSITNRKKPIPQVEHILRNNLASIENLPKNENNRIILGTSRSAACNGSSVIWFFCTDCVFVISEKKLESSGFLSKRKAEFVFYLNNLDFIPASNKSGNRKYKLGDIKDAKQKISFGAVPLRNSFFLQVYESLMIALHFESGLEIIDKPEKDYLFPTLISLEKSEPLPITSLSTLKRKIAEVESCISLVEASLYSKKPSLLGGLSSAVASSMTESANASISSGSSTQPTTPIKENSSQTLRITKSLSKSTSRSRIPQVILPSNVDIVKLEANPLYWRPVRLPSGRYYYYHVRTEKTTWRPPQGFVEGQYENPPNFEEEPSEKQTIYIPPMPETDNPALLKLHIHKLEIMLKEMSIQLESLK